MKNIAQIIIFIIFIAWNSPLLVFFFIISLWEGNFKHFNIFYKEIGESIINGFDGE